ncbi:ATP-binding protein [Actinoplanes derwentensis]|uniref:histidine kinase n=1 Tax=Actinoplanes derwentensis TaxID=113562 RepID=A0A1H1V6K1_9ACTN|nr:ATP-binding protein [Actinoplanes derwentensis]GID89249.1 hypothetical protein Ade03nite_81730 [Actinoplanes derwentensis]SDS80434.1 PAS fold-containing protein [Actinoplanes derwentensis]
MLFVDETVLGDPARLAAVDRARRLLPVQPLPLNALVRMAARLLHAPLATMALAGRDGEHLVSAHGAGEAGAEGACGHVVSLNRPVRSGFLGVPIRDDGGQPVGALAVFDSAERVWTDGEEAALTEIAELLRATGEAEARDRSLLSVLLENLSASVIACDDTGRVIALNRSAREAHGLSATGPMPPDYESTADGVLRDSAMRPLAGDHTPLIRALHGEHLDAVDVLTTTPGDQIRTFATTARPLTARDGRLLGALAVADELTEIRRAERFRICHLAVDKALRTAQTESGAALGVLTAVGTTLGWPCAELFLIDESTGLLRSAAHWDVSGHDTDGFFGNPPSRGMGVTGRVWESGRPLWVADVAIDDDLIKPRELAEVRVWRRRGIRTVLAVPVHDGDTMLGVLICCADSREDHEQLLTVLLEGVAAQFGVYVASRRTAQVTRQLARAQDDLIALVGHEMRTPLTSIAANVTMLVEDSGDLGEDVRQMLRSVARNTTALQRIVDKLLDLAGLDSGYLLLDLEKVDLAVLLAGTVSATRHLAADTGVVLRTALPAHLVLDGDTVRLRQVVDDLLSNAVKYSPLGGEVRIALTTDDTMAELRITDTGIGTSADERGRVFDRFFRGSNVRHQGTVGSGLGLSLASTIVRMHGGAIQLAANQPTGTVVTVRLPLPVA